MSDHPESKKKIAHLMAGVSLGLGILAVIGTVAFEAANSDLGMDLGIDSKGARTLLAMGSWIATGLGLVAAASAGFVAPTLKSRIGAFLPGAILNGSVAAIWILA